MRWVLALVMLAPVVAGAQPMGPIDPQSLMCVGVKDGASLGRRCVEGCVVEGVGRRSYLQRQDLGGGKYVEVYGMGGDYVCPQHYPVSEEQSAALHADAEKTVGAVCGEGNLVEVQRLDVVLLANRVQVSAKVWCKALLAEEL